MAKVSGRTRDGASSRVGNVPVRGWRALVGALGRGAAGNPDMVLMALCVVYLLVFLTYLAAWGQYVRPAAPGPAVFGQAAAEEVADPEPAPSQPVSDSGIVFFLCFSGLMWCGAVWSWRRVGRRVARIMMMMLTPGTLLAVYFAVRWVWMDGV